MNELQKISFEKMCSEAMKLVDDILPNFCDLKITVQFGIFVSIKRLIGSFEGHVLQRKHVSRHMYKQWPSKIEVQKGGEGAKDTLDV